MRADARAILGKSDVSNQCQAVCRLVVNFTFFYSIQKIVLPPDTKPFIGVYTVEGLAYLRFLEVKLVKGQLLISYNGQLDVFVLNYTKPLTFTIIFPPSLTCVNKFIFGVENDLVVFDSPSNVDGLCDKFAMYSASPSGKTFFYRARD